MSSLSRAASTYYVPQQSQWPIVAGCALLLTTLGAATWINSGSAGPYVFAGGVGLLLSVLIGWFGTVIRESEAGAYNEQVDRSFRWAMGWFIFSETTFFAAFFGALFYLRWHAAPDLASGDTAQLWPGFAGGWPATGPAIEGALQPMRPIGIALINTLILLTSAATLLWARRGLQNGARRQLKLGLAVTVALGVLFLCLQVSEYYHAYTAQGLTLASGAYGATFFLLTGFHGLHVGVGATVLTVMFGRSVHGDFTPDDHFGLSAAAWYWQFVDVIWLLLYVLVYWL